MSTAIINKAILQWGIQRSGVPREDIIKKFKKINDWINGDKYPTFKQLENLSNVLHIPLGYFFLDKPPIEKLPIPDFRSSNQNIAPSPNLMDIIYLTLQRQKWLSDYLKDCGYKPLRFVGSMSIKDAEKIVTDIRETLDLQENWSQSQTKRINALTFLVQKTEAIGINVSRSGIVGDNTKRILDPEEFRGFVIVDDYAPFIFINTQDAISAQIFTLAHELAHIWIGSSALFDLRNLDPYNNEKEILCNRVAGELLVPQEQLLNVWKRVKNDTDKYQKLANDFNVSELVIVRRLYDTKCISRKAFEEHFTAYLNKEIKQSKRKSSGGNNYLTHTSRLGKVFVKHLVQAVKQGSISYRDAYQLTNRFGTNFDRYSDYVLEQVLK